MYYNQKDGEVSEWSKVTDSKSVVQLILNRGFESLPLRQEQSHLNTYVEMRFFYGCINGVAYIVVPTQKVTPKKSYHYLNQKRDEYGNFIKSDNVQ